MCGNNLPYFYDSLDLLNAGESRHHRSQMRCWINKIQVL